MAAVGERRARSPTRVFFVPPSRHLSCSLCDDNFKEILLPCGHTFCRACVVRWFERQRTCPECRADTAPGAPLPTNWTVRAQVDELRVRCRFGVKEEGDGWVADEAGCPAQLALDGAAAHEAACGFATTTCPFAGCGVELRRDQADAHDAAFAVAHARGERASRLADAKIFEALAAAATSRVALVEARLAALEQRPPALLGAPLAPPVPVMLSDGWTAGHTIQTGGNVSVFCCALSPDGSTACVGLAGALQLFDVASGDHRRTLEGHRGDVFCCAFSPDGSTLVSGSRDKTMMLWNAATDALIRTLEGHTEMVWCCAFYPDRRSICLGSRDKSLKLWDAVSGECQRTLDGHAGHVRCCAYNADGATVLAGGQGKSLKLWSVATGACIRTFTGHTDWVLGCCFSPADGNTILSGSWDFTLKLWDATTGECRHTLIGHAGEVRGCAFSPIHGNLVLSCSDDMRLKLWDTTTGACTATLEGHESPVTCCAVNHDGSVIASGDNSGKLKLWGRV